MPENYEDSKTSPLKNQIIQNEQHLGNKRRSHYVQDNNDDLHQEHKRELTMSALESSKGYNAAGKMVDSQTNSQPIFSTLHGQLNNQTGNQGEAASAMDAIDGLGCDDDDVATFDNRGKKEADGLQNISGLEYNYNIM